MKRRFKGIWIPREIWENNEMTLQEKVFYAEIDSLDNEDGCYANNEYFAKFFGISKVRVSEVINSLAEKGFISSDISQSKGNRRLLHTLINFPLRPSPEKVDDPHKGLFNHSNTVDNKVEFNNAVSSDTAVPNATSQEASEEGSGKVQGSSPKKGKKEKLADECFADFKKIWWDAFKALGFDAVTGKCLNEMISKTRQYQIDLNHVPVKENTVQMFRNAVEYLAQKKHWAAFKPITTVNAHYRSILHEVQTGVSVVKSNRQPTASELFGDYGALRK